ncbi:MAG: dTDP-glucose 4,6-dehydratase [Candidatus Omnitrophota bacterium]
MKNILVTGGCGFIGSNFIRVAINNGYKIINLDVLTYAGNLENLADIENDPNYKFIKGDIADRILLEKIILNNKIDCIINFAAESHVDRSILNATPFIRTNIMGTQALLDTACKHNIERFIQISTDEVYGSLGKTGFFTEETPLAPNSPYSASKAGADLLVRAYVKTFELPAVIIRCSNNYGPFQFPEKFIPLIITNALNDQLIPLYGDGLNIRDWIFVKDFCQAICLVMEKGRVGEIYNVGGNSEKTNIDLLALILDQLKKPKTLIKKVKDRLGHDRRYAIDFSKIKNELGWEPEYKFKKGITETIQWYLDHREWVQRVRSHQYQQYYDQNYKKRLNEPDNEDNKKA